MATAERGDPVPSPQAKLTIRGLRTRAVRVPLRRPLGTSGGTIAHAPLVLIDLETEEGVPGRAYLFAYSDVGARALRQLLAGILEMVRGEPVAPVAIAKKLHARFTLLGREGLPTIAMSGLDVALWDALARATALPLARLLGGELDRERVYWIEEPVRHDDYAGAARIAREVETPIQIGENFLGTRAMAAAIAAGAADYVMPDLGRIGGVTGWLRAAALADAAGLEMSSHLHPEVSAQLLAVTPSAHFLEYVDWAVPILARPLEIADGQALPAEAPGAGLDWNEEAVARFALD